MNLTSGRVEGVLPDTVNLIIWLIAGVAGGNAVGDFLLKGDYDLGAGNSVAGAIGGVVAGLILHTLIPSLRDFDYGPIVGQAVGAVAGGAALVVIAAKIRAQRRG
jgi:hypothetical protein